jgi:hypothetical protein
VKAVQTVDHHSQLVAAPRLSRHVAIDVFEAQHDPTAFVVDPQQSSYGTLRWQRRHHLSFATVQARCIGVSKLADSFDETATIIAGADPRRQAWRETAGLSHRFDNGAADAFFDRPPH